MVCMPNTTCPAACPCRTTDPRNERELADNMLARCRCGEVFHQGHATDRGPCPVCRAEAGTRRVPARAAGRFALVAAVLLAVFAGACQATAPRVEVETVGTLAPSYRSIATAPVAASTDLSRGSFVASDDDDAPVAVGAGEVSPPDVVTKTGLVMGGVR
jgi:hypothetical protein